MPVPVPIEYRRESRSGDGFTPLYGALLLLTLHWAVVLYVNSSYLEQFLSPSSVSALYLVSAVLTMLGFVYASPALRRFGNVRMAIILTVLEFFSLLGMAFAETTLAALFYFVIHQAVVPLILFCLDVLTEELIGDGEETTGERRGVLLTIMSLMYALAALGMGKLVGPEEPNFSLVYIASAVALVPFFYILVTKFRTFKDPAYPAFNVFDGIAYFWKYRDLRNVFFAHFLLQVFFTWMVIYTPIYLADTLGFNWEEVGIILFAGLMAYVLLEYLVGLAADKWIGEKEMMAFGFAVAAVATSWFVFLDGSSLILWMTAMFMTRVGAALVEVTTESYFFKHTGAKDTNVIGLFRITRPLSYVFGAFLGSVALGFIRFEMLFVLLGLLMIPGLFFAMALKDTK